MADEALGLEDGVVAGGRSTSVARVGRNTVVGCHGYRGGFDRARWLPGNEGGCSGLVSGLDWLSLHQDVEEAS